MLIREYTEADLDALRRMHARQGFDYPFPNLADPIFVSKLVVEDDSGRAVMASLARLTCEMYLLVERDYESSATSHGVISGFGSPMDSTGVLKSDPMNPVGKAVALSFFHARLLLSVGSPPAKRLRLSSRTQPRLLRMGVRDLPFGCRNGPENHIPLGS
jgi:hypothetical protein